MTATTPEQLRALAARLRTEQPSRQELEAALRTAADQLEALDIVSRGRSVVPYETVRAILTSEAIILTADTAPQENERTVMRVEGHPRVGDVYEGKYGAAKGKRIRLVRFNDAPAHLNRWFATQTIHHPSSPRMIGSTGTVGVQQLEDRWRLVKAEASDD